MSFGMQNIVKQALRQEKKWDSNKFNYDDIGELTFKDIQFINMLEHIGNAELSGYAMTSEIDRLIKKNKREKDFSSAMIFHGTIIIPDEFRHGLVAQELINKIKNKGKFQDEVTVDELYGFLKGENVWKNIYHALLSLMYSEIQNESLYKLATEYIDNPILKRIYTEIRKDESNHKIGYFNEIKSLCNHDQHHFKKFVKSIHNDMVGYQVQFHEGYGKALAHAAYLFGTESIITNNTEFYDRCLKLFGAENMPEVEKVNFMQSKHYLSIHMDKQEYASLYKKYANNTTGRHGHLHN